MRQLVIRVVALLVVVASVTFGNIQGVYANGEDKPDRAEPVSLDQAFEEVVVANPETIVHETPSVPVIIDGTRYEPQDIHRFDGQVLHFLIDDQALKNGVFYAFTSKKALKEHLKEKDGKAGKFSQSHFTAKHTNSWDRNSYFYEHTWYWGSRLALDVGYLYNSLGGWNDRISSVRATPNGWGTVLYEHSYRGGMSMYVRASQDIPDLRPYGWNDRTSSIAVYW